MFCISAFYSSSCLVRVAENWTLAILPLVPPVGDLHSPRTIRKGKSWEVSLQPLTTKFRVEAIYTVWRLSSRPAAFEIEPNLNFAFKYDGLFQKHSEILYQ